jgi:hypothetical protein
MPVKRAEMVAFFDLRRLMPERRSFCLCFGTDDPTCPVRVRLAGRNSTA